MAKLDQIGILPEPSHWPIAMRRFGINPYGEPVFRITWAPSVKMLVGGQWPDGSIGYKARPAYRNVGKEWVLEKWISAFDHTKGMTPEQYEIKFRDPMSGLLTTGPYPERGVYFMCHTFNGSPANGGIDKIVGLIEKAKRNNPADNRAAMMNTMEREESAAAKERFDRCKEMLPAFGVRAASYRGHVKATKTAPLTLTAQQAGLPQRTGPQQF